MAIDPGLRRLALRTLLAAFPGPAAPDWAAHLLADGLAGHTLFGTNIADPAQVGRLTAELRTVRRDALIAIDEEGGDVTRMAHRTGSPYPGNAALGTVDDPELTRTVYTAIGADLATAGINLDLAPTVDVNTADDNPVIGTRSFGTDPWLVARHTTAAIEGLQSSGVAACAKHFPGHGATTADSHLELPTVDAELSLLRERDLPPFAAAVAAGARAIMTAHIRVPVLTGGLPATFSHEALTGLLRGELGFTGAIVTDALEMKGAARVAGGIGAGAVLALAAGADLLCLGARVSPEVVELVVAEIVAGIGDGRLGLGRLEDAAGRTAALASWAQGPAASVRPGAGLGYPGPAGSEAGFGWATPPEPGTGPGHAAPPASGTGLGRAAPLQPETELGHAPPLEPGTGLGYAAAPGPGTGLGYAAAPGSGTGPGYAAPPGPATGLGYAAARRAVRVEGSLVELGGPLVVQLESGHSIAEGRVPWGLKPHLNGTEQVSVVAADASAEALAERAGSRPIVVVGRHTHRAEATRALIETLAARHTVAVVEMGWPTDWRPVGARAFVTTYGASHANGRAAAEALGLTATS